MRGRQREDAAPPSRRVGSSGASQTARIECRRYPSSREPILAAKTDPASIEAMSGAQGGDIAILGAAGVGFKSAACELLDRLP
jgi:hypothetical protein